MTRRHVNRRSAAGNSIGTELNSVGRTHFYGVEGIDFSVGLWVRPHPSAKEKSRAVFASVGDGWSSG
jgi:hypothetical protein